MKLKLSPDWRIASATSKGDGRPRWTEIHVYVIPDEEAARQGTGRRFVAQVLACSTMHGERTKERRVATGTLERALGWIDDSDLGAAVKVTAREYAIEMGEPDVPGVLRQCISACDQAGLIDCDYRIVDEARTAAFELLALLDPGSAYDDPGRVRAHG